MIGSLRRTAVVVGVLVCSSLSVRTAECFGQATGCGHDIAPNGYTYFLKGCRDVFISTSGNTSVPEGEAAVPLVVSALGEWNEKLKVSLIHTTRGIDADFIVQGSGGLPIGVTGSTQVITEGGLFAVGGRITLNSSSDIVWAEDYSYSIAAITVHEFGHVFMGSGHFGQGAIGCVFCEELGNDIPTMIDGACDDHYVDEDEVDG